ncbi:MAG: 50S ribosomal protein L23 [Candidatus Kerfeldbacteria bacterium]|nr:50S ribosomal protein L23 [Candidatus Kerfeldbacteria bacterium]
MSFFDRFTSKKGKDQQATPKKGVVTSTSAKDSEKKAFAAVPSGKEQPAKSATKPAKTAAPVTSDVAHEAHRVLLRPVVTEKSTRVGQQSQYIFEVALHASKTDVRQAVLHLFGVRPTAVNMIVQDGKHVRFGRTYGQTIARKKAVISLPAGKTIDVFSA